MGGRETRLAHQKRVERFDGLSPLTGRVGLRARRGELARVHDGVAQLVVVKHETHGELDVVPLNVLELACAAARRRRASQKTADRRRGRRRGSLSLLRARPARALT